MVMFDWLLGSSKDVNTSNPQSMHYKGAKVGDKTVPVRISPCYCGLRNINSRLNDEFVMCEFCKEAEKELKTREGLYETAKGTPISKLKQIKPHYKWSWKLNKAVRL